MLEKVQTLWTNEQGAKLLGVHYEFSVTKKHFDSKLVHYYWCMSVIPLAVSQTLCNNHCFTIMLDYVRLNVQGLSLVAQSNCLKLL